MSCTIYIAVELTSLSHILSVKNQSFLALTTMQKNIQHSLLCNKLSQILQELWGSSPVGGLSVIPLVCGETWQMNNGMESIVWMLKFFQSPFLNAVGNWNCHAFKHVCFEPVGFFLLGTESSWLFYVIFRLRLTTGIRSKVNPCGSKVRNSVVLRYALRKILHWGIWCIRTRQHDAFFRGGVAGTWI